MFLKHGAKKVNEIELVAPTGFEPVFRQRPRLFTRTIAPLRRSHAKKPPPLNTQADNDFSCRVYR